jgi:hypothetical protein
MNIKLTTMEKVSYKEGKIKFDFVDDYCSIRKCALVSWKKIPSAWAGLCGGRVGESRLRGAGT